MNNNTKTMIVTGDTQWSDVINFCRKNILLDGDEEVTLSITPNTNNNNEPKNLSEYIDKLSKQFPEVSFAKLSRIAVRVARWQKEHMDNNIELYAGGNE
jgi:hypothetical protein